MADSNLPESPLDHLPPMQEPTCPRVDEAGLASLQREELARGAIPVVALIVALTAALALFLWQPELFRQLRQNNPGSSSPSEAAQADGQASPRSAVIASPFPGSSHDHLSPLSPGGLNTLEVFLDDSLAKREGGRRAADAAPIDDLWVTVSVLGEPTEGAKFVWTSSRLSSEVLDTELGGLRLELPRSGTVHLAIVCRRGFEHLVYTALLQDGAAGDLHLAPAETHARLTFERPEHVDTIECEFQIVSYCETNAAGEALPEAHPVWIHVPALLEAPDFTAEFIGLPGDYRVGSFHWSPSPGQQLRPADLANLPEFEWKPPMTSTLTPWRR
jgi:hypothetical protein